MKSILKTTGMVTFIAIGLSFTLTNNDDESVKEPNRVCEFSFYVKCDGSNQFVETVKAKSFSEAQTKTRNRYPKCKVSTKSSNPKNCE